MSDAIPFAEASKNLHRWTREHPNWRVKHPVGPVTWDFRCQQCGFTIEDIPTVGTGEFSATKNGRTIAQRWSKDVLCTGCAPIHTGNQ